MVPPSELPPFKNCINSVIKLAYSIDQYSIKEQVELFQDAVAFLCHLKEDVRSIPSCKDIDKLQVLCQVIENRNLLHALMFMLADKLPMSSGKSALNEIRHAATPSTQTKQKIKVEGETLSVTPLSDEFNSRKRSLSVSSTEEDGSVNKRAPASQTWKFTAPSSNCTPSTKSLTFTTQSQTAISFNKQVFAAIVLNTSFRYVDQWPPIFVEAYCGDLFSARAWVDDPRCSDFVANINNFLNESGQPKQLETESMKQVSKRLANLYGKGYSELQIDSHQLFDDVTDKNVETTASSILHKSESSNSNQDSDSSDSGDEEIIEEVSSSIAVRCSPVKMNDRKEKMRSIIQSGNTHHSSKKDASSDSSDNESDNEEILVEEAGFSSIIQGVSNGLKSDTSCSMLDNPWLHASNARSSYICLDYGHIRCRVFGINRNASINMVEQCLRSRLESRTKHSNSSLLACLPDFLPAVPAVRVLVSTHLEKWLQSPALADLSRSLFTKVVDSLTITNPPLQEDLDVISLILAMKLKSNQQELQDRLDQPLLSQGHVSDKQKLFVSIYSVFPSDVAASGFASSILKLSRSNKRQDVIDLLQSLISCLGISYDGANFVKYLIESSRNQKTDNLDIERYMDDVAHILFESEIMIPEVAGNINDKQSKTLPVKSDRLRTKAKSVIAHIRMLVLEWCLTTYSSLYYDNIVKDEMVARHNEESPVVVNARTKNTKVSNKHRILGAGLRDFKSAIVEDIDNNAQNERKTAQKLLLKIECLCLLTDDPEKLRSFSGENIVNNCSKYALITRCVNICTSFDDNMLQLILNSSDESNTGLTSATALLLLETIFLKLKDFNEEDRFHIKDVGVVWDMYKLSKYIPSETNSHELAYPGRWWRVTFLILIICGSSKSIGSKMWKSHPTLKALITMITSGRYCFPTVDCDEHQRLMMKKGEKDCRDEESEIAADIFLHKSSDKSKQQIIPPLYTKEEKRGVRLSARQRAIREKQLLFQQQEEAAKIRAESERIKQLLGEATKTIMISNPHRVARKPPREAVNLLVTIQDIFQLSNSFRISEEPDFLLMSIGDKSRQSIERAYGWILPIISTHSNIIERLPSSASCFLLLKAYGNDFEDSDKSSALSGLATPLLLHVRKCLSGDFGENDSIQAADLLLRELYSKNAEQRHCVRRVLERALNDNDCYEDKVTQGWLTNLLKSKFASSLIQCVVTSVSLALVHERGRVLCYYILALHEYSKYIKANSLILGFEFTSILCDILSKRPKVVSAAIDKYDALRNLTLSTIQNEFENKFGNMRLCTNHNDEDILFQASDSDKEAIIPMSLLRACIILISFWNEPVGDVTTSYGPSNKTIQVFTSWLLGDGSKSCQDRGVVGASFAKTGKKAVTVDHWVMLTKARCDNIGRLAALCAPLNLLPRLCLSCGLSRISFEMLLGRLNDFASSSTSNDESDSFNNISSFSCSAGFGACNGNRRMRMKKLFGRINAYFRIFGLQNTDSIFLDWLRIELNKSSINQGKRIKRKRISHAETIDNGLTNQDIDKLLVFRKEISDEKIYMKGDDDYTDEPTITFYSKPDESRNKSLQEISANLVTAIERNDIYQFNITIGNLRKFCNELSFTILLDEGQYKDLNSNLDISMKLIECVVFAQKKFNIDILPVLIDLILNLSIQQGYPRLWQSIFSSDDTEHIKRHEEVVISRCSMVWSCEHIRTCQDWLMSNWKNTKVNLSPARCISFLLKTMVQHESQQLPTCSRPLFTCSSRINQSSIATSMIIQLLQDNPNLRGYSSGHSNPQWFCFLLAIASDGQDSCRHIFRQFMEIINKEEFLWPLLRLYTSFPYLAPLDVESVRTLLLNLASIYSEEWKEWSCPLDETVHALTTHLTKLGVQALSDLCRKQPLLVIRHFLFIIKELENDGFVVSHGGIGEKRGRIYATSQLTAYCHERSSEIKVRVKHWGYSFTKSLWISVLEVISSFPKEVLFHLSGIRMGSTLLIEVYLKLYLIQILLSDDHNILRMKSLTKLLLEKFKEQNESEWNAWLKSTIFEFDDWGTVEEILDKCALST